MTEFSQPPGGNELPSCVPSANTALISANFLFETLCVPAGLQSGA